MKLLVVILVLVALPSHQRLATGAELSLSQCREERQKYVNKCKLVLFGWRPSSACCQLIRAGNFECVCPVVDPKLVALLTLTRVVKTLRECSRPVPHNFRCGSLYFP